MEANVRNAMEAIRPYLDQAKPYVGDVLLHLEKSRLAVNEYCQKYEAWQLIFFTFGFTLIVVWIWDILFQEEQSLRKRVSKTFFRNIRKLPFVKGKVQAEVDKTLEGMVETFNKGAKGLDYVQSLPKKGFTEKEVFDKAMKYKGLASDWRKGGCSGTVYSGDQALTDLMTKVYGEFAWTNPLHPDVFPDVRKMEAEVVRMTCTMFNGGPETCGCMTSGGTESIMLACKAYRDIAMERGVNFPEMLVPHTAHAAFDKAAQFFRMKIKHIPVDEKTRKVDVKAMKRAIDRNTCMLVGSAPGFPHGILDPIEEIAKLGLRYNIPVHVDSCLGGFLVPFMKKAGFEIPPFDFSLPGVTSISADTHKYGFAPKGSSVIMYSSEYYRRYQIFVQPDWPGGIYACPTIAGSRAGAIIAACWATMMHIGEKGYVESTKKIITVTKEIEAGIRKIDGVFVYGKPDVSVVGIGSKDFNIFRLSDALTQKGWNLNALQFPSSVHLCCTLLHTKPGVAKKFVQDVTDCVKEILKDPSAKCGGAGAIYGMAQSIPDRSLVSEMASCFFDAYYNTQKEVATNGKA